MPIKTRAYLKTKFENGDIPTQDDFSDLIESYVHESEDGITIYRAPDQTIRLGIGVPVPFSPLGIKATGDDQLLISFHNADGSSTWSINQNPTSGDIPGLNFQQQTSSDKVSRLFINQPDGRIGIGTTAPKRLLELNENNADGVTALKIKNTASSVTHPGWSMGHVNNVLFGSEKDGSFSFLEESSNNPGTLTERMTILAGGNVGINELVPDTKLHVTIPEANSNAPVALLPHSGIAQFGPVTKSIVADFQGVQARSGVYDTTNTLQLSTSTLHLQNLGGDILIHGKTTIAESQKVVLKDNINTGTSDPNTGLGLGIGTLTPKDKLHVNGRIVIGDSSNTAVAGAIRSRVSGSINVFEGWNGTAWVPFGGDNIVWESTAGTNIRFIPQDAYVGIGIGSTSEPTAQLDVLDNTVLTMAQSESATQIRNSSRFNTDPDETVPTPGNNDNRIGLQISSASSWNGDTSAKDIGLYIAGISGHLNAEGNLAAVFDGNVFVGGITPGVNMIGTNGSKILALQNGVAPSGKIPGSQNLVPAHPTVSNANANGVQVYSALTGSVTTNPTTGVTTDNRISTLHIMDGGGTVVNLFRGSPIAIRDTSTISTTTYNTTVAGVINNLRSRINDLESRLVSNGLIATQVASPINHDPPPSD